MQLIWTQPGMSSSLILIGIHIVPTTKANKVVRYKPTDYGKEKGAGGKKVLLMVKGCSGVHHHRKGAQF